MIDEKKDIEVVDKTPENKEVLLSVKNVDVHFKVKKNVVKACNHVSFDIYKGYSLSGNRELCGKG